VSSAVTGVAISLVGSGSTELTVGSAPGAIANVLSTVATNLNAAVASIAKETAFVPASSSSASASSASSAKSGPLLGNFTASDISNQLLTSVTGAAASGLTSNAIGLTVSSTGAVSFNSSTFATAYAANPTGVTALVSKIYNNLSTVSTNALGSAASSGSSVNTTGNGSNKGSIAAQVASLNTTIKSLDSSAAAISKSNNAQLQILISEYSATEAAQTAASTTEAYLSIFTSTSSGSASKG
jgi:flagellar hook-associated protein 2